MQVGSVVQSVKVARRAGSNASGGAFCGGVLGAMAVMVHEGYTVFSGHCLPIDPFTHVMAELAVFAPGSAAVLGIAANVRNWLVRKNHLAHLRHHDLPSAGGT
jgi:hypothetical protein